MYRYSNGQISLSDFKQPVGMNLKESNRWVKKAQTIPWSEIEKRYAALFTNRKGAMLPNLCGWLWEPASYKQNTDTQTKKQPYRFRKTRICSISVDIPAMMMTDCPSTHP